MFEEEPETSSPISDTRQSPTTQLVDASSLPPSPPSAHRRRSSRPHAQRHRSGSVPCRRPRDQRRARLLGRRRATTTSTSMVGLSTFSVPQIVVVDQNERQVSPVDDDNDDRLQTNDSAFRPRCRTVSLDPTDRSPSLVQPGRSRTLSVNKGPIFEES